MIQWTTSQEYIDAMLDEDLLAALERTTGKLGDPEADLLRAEIERRGLRA